MYESSTSLYKHVCFVADSEPCVASVVDMRCRELNELYSLLDSGELIWRRQSMYFPIVMVTLEPQNTSYYLELTQPRTQPYQMGEMLPLRVLSTPALEAKECHGFFLWGGGLLRLALALCFTALTYGIFRYLRRSAKKTHITSVLVAVPTEDSTPTPKKRSTRKAKDDVAPAPKKRSTRKAKDDTAPTPKKRATRKSKDASAKTARKSRKKPADESL